MKSAKAHLVTSSKQLYQNNASMKYNICSECFYDEGLKLTSEKIGINNSHICPNCNKSNGLKISSLAEYKRELIRERTNADYNLQEQEVKREEDQRDMQKKQFLYY